MEASPEVASGPHASTSLTIIGASARAAADSARRAFFSPHTADLFADLDLAESCPAIRVSDYPVGLEAILRGPQTGGWLYTGGLENYPDLIDRWSKIRPLWGNHGSVLRRVRDPQLLTEKLRDADFPAPEFALSFSEVTTDGTWLIKPSASAGGQHIARLTSTTEIPSTPYYLQLFIEGETISAVYLADGHNVVLLGLTRQLLEPGTFRYMGSIGPITVTPAIHSEFERLGQTLAQQFGLIGIFGVDTVVNESGIHTIEVNPRYPAGAEVLERAQGFSAIVWHVAACQSGKLPTQASHSLDSVSHFPATGRGAGGDGPHSTNRLPIVGKMILYAETAIRIPTNLRHHLTQIADVPHPGDQIPKDSPILTVVRSASSESELRQALVAAIHEARQLLDQQTPNP